MQRMSPTPFTEGSTPMPSPVLPPANGSPQQHESLRKTIDVAAQLSISRQTVVNMARRGTLDAVRIGKQIMIKNASVQKLLNTRGI
jgi:excisionase family DNA binding protein